MLAILRPEAEADWLNLDTSPEQALELIQPYPGEEMESYEISKFINSSANARAEVMNGL